MLSNAYPKLSQRFSTEGHAHPSYAPDIKSDNANVTLQYLCVFRRNNKLFMLHVTICSTTMRSQYMLILDPERSFFFIMFANLSVKDFAVMTLLLWAGEGENKGKLKGFGNIHHHETREMCDTIEWTGL